MQYVWQHRLWLPSDMTTVDGLHIDVLDPGLLNTDAGPDFFNAKIRIGDRTWVGNVEIHVRATDWHRHHHDSDQAYDSVILHVVEQSDTTITRSNGETIPQVVMPCAANFSVAYHEMVDRPADQVPCAEHIAKMPPIYLTDWLTSLAFERLYEKADRATALAQRLGGDWGQVIYVVLARALGFSTNSEPFERLALLTPLRKLMRHSDSPITIEGALFGQAGFLDAIPEDATDPEYIRRLKAEYVFIAHKYGLDRPQFLGWRMGRMRPQNFPHRRLAMLAQMISHGFTIGYDLLNVRSLEQARALFNIQLTGFWSHRYNFGPESTGTPVALSKSSIDTLVINVVAPILHAYGTATGHADMCEIASDILQELPAENNAIIRLYTAAGIPCTDAFTSQALIQLRRNYCEPRKCLYCRIGHRYLATKAIRRQKQNNP